MSRIGRLLLPKLCSLTFVTGCQPHAVTPTVCEHRPLPTNSVRILWAGDTLLGDAAQSEIDKYGYDWPFENLHTLFEDTEAAILNAEAPITILKTPYETNKRWSYNVQPEAAAALRRVGFTAAGLANNHIMDRGPKGLEDTLSHLSDAGLSVFGAGKNSEQASAPLLLDTSRGRIAVIALGQHWSDATVATSESAGTLPINAQTIRTGLTRAKAADADWTVAFVHWGVNYRDIDPNQIRQQLLLSGFDQVIGHGSHTVQPLAKSCSSPTVFSLGNFVFGTPGRFTEGQPGYGLITYTHITNHGVDSLEFRCIKTDNNAVHFQPTLCSSGEAAGVFASLHPDIQIDENIAWLSLKLPVD